MRPKNEKPICDFVRNVLSVATGERIEVTEQPDGERRLTKEVEELWASSNHRFAIEHTLLESFVGQLTDDAKFVKLVAPVEGILNGKLPGTFALAVEVGASTAAKVRYDEAHRRIADAVLHAASTLSVGKAIRLDVENVPFPIHLFRRSEESSRIFVRRSVSDIEPSRLDRVRRALVDKCPKLASARINGRYSVLAPESNDIALANYHIVGQVVRQALQERSDCPDLVMVVESDAGPFHGWIIRNETGIPLKEHYVEGEF
jgi:hypothetical protein